MTDNKLILNLFAKALGNEKFLNIDKVENNGKTVYGNFKAGQWGTFRVFLSFTKMQLENLKDWILVRQIDF